MSCRQLIPDGMWQTGGNGIIFWGRCVGKTGVIYFGADGHDEWRCCLAAGKLVLQWRGSWKEQAVGCLIVIDDLAGCR